MYILDYDRQIQRANEMTLLRKDTESWVVYYHDPSSNRMWKSFYPRTNGNQRGPKLMRIEPVPKSLDKLINCCLTSELEEDAIGLGIELSSKPQQWKEVICHLEEKYRDYNRKQILRFLKALGVELPIEMLQKNGHDPAYYNLDEKHLKDLKWRSKKIRFKRFWVFW